MRESGKPLPNMAIHPGREQNAVDLVVPRTPLQARNQRRHRRAVEFAEFAESILGKFQKIPFRAKIIARFDKALISPPIVITDCIAIAIGYDVGIRSY
jgi:hypothetical protein